MVPLTFLAWLVASVCPAKSSPGFEANADPSTSFDEDKVVQVLTLNGNKLAEITAKGEVWLAGDCVGSIEKSGEIWVDGTKEGEITDSGEVWKSGEKIGEITNKGEVWREGEEIGTLEKDGTVWIDGSADGFYEGGNMKTAAIVFFFDFFSDEAL